MQPHDNATKKGKGTGILKVLHSVIAAIFGIQSDKNREEDFSKGDPSQYIVMGIVVVVAIVIGMIVLVSTVLDSAANT